MSKFLTRKHTISLLSHLFLILFVLLLSILASKYILDKPCQDGFFIGLCGLSKMIIISLIFILFFSFIVFSSLIRHFSFAKEPTSFIRIFIAYFFSPFMGPFVLFLILVFFAILGNIFAIFLASFNSVLDVFF